MDSLFGIPMNTIMVVMIVLLGIALATVGLAALRNRVMFLVGLRNIPRRVAQTVLIIIGLMLSTLIISAAFTTGDTVDYSISKAIYDSLGHVDEIIEYNTEDGNGGLGDVTIPESTYEELRDGLNVGEPPIDGVAPVLIEIVPGVNEKTHLSEPSLNVMGFDPATMDAFPDLVNLQGETVYTNDLGENEAYLNKSAADELDAVPGDTVTIYYENQPFKFTVADVVRDAAASGSVDPMGGGEGMVGRLSTFQKAFNRTGVFDFIVVSNTGGVRDSLAYHQEAVDKIERVIEEKKLNLELGETKQEDIEFAEMFGNAMMTFFLVLGLFSIAAGILLIIMIFVMLAAERKTEMGITRAVGTKRRHLIQMFMSEGMGYNVVSAFVGVVLGIAVALALTFALGAVFSEFGVSISPRVSARSLVISYSLGIILTFITVVFSSWRVSNLNIVRAIRDLPEPEKKPRLRSLVIGICILLFGAFMTYVGISSKTQFPYVFGVSLVFFGIALGGRYLRVPERPLFTTIGLILLAFWMFGAGDRLPDWLTANRELTEGGIEMFFLSGVVMVASAVFVLVYNADLLLNVFSLAAGRASRILPAVKTAIAYPMASKFRTGMTMAMISLVIFALTTMSTMNFNFSKLYLSDKARGGWDVQVTENPNNPIGDLKQALAGSSVDTSQFTSLGALSVAKLGVSDVRQLPAEGEADTAKEYDPYIVKSADEGFLSDPRLTFTARATDYKDDASVWEALRTNPDFAIIDIFAVPEDFAFGGDMFTLSGVDGSTTVFDPIRLEVRDDASGQSREVELIGILSSGPSGGDPMSSFAGLYVSPAVMQEVFGGPDFTTDFIRLADPGQSEKIADGIESTLSTTGAQADSIKAQREDETALYRNFFYLMQAFMGLGLVVGIAAVGVIAFRTVVERRQQIGMLRAIGYKRSTIALSFLMESSFVTLLGILSGVGLALALAYFLVTSGELGEEDVGFYVDWMQLILISFFAYGASLLMTFIPARQAASIPIAEALRYE